MLLQGLLRPLLLGAVLMLLTNLIFAYLAATGRDITLLMLTISGDNLAAGVAGSAFIAYMSSLTSAGFTATQYALFSSLYALPGKLIRALRKTGLARAEQCRPEFLQVSGRVLHPGEVPVQEHRAAESVAPPRGTGGQIRLR